MAVWKRVKSAHADLMAGFAAGKLRAVDEGHGKFIPHPTTRLNWEGRNDAIAGDATGTTGMSPEEIAAKVADIRARAKRRQDEFNRVTRRHGLERLGLSE